MATRLNINVNNETAKLLRELAERNETSITEIIRRAVGVYKHIEDADRDGKTIKLVGKEETETMMFVR